MLETIDSWIKDFSYFDRGMEKLFFIQFGKKICKMARENIENYDIDYKLNKVFTKGF